METETIITDFNRVNGILVELTMKEITSAIYSDLVDFYEKYRNTDFANWIEYELKNSKTTLDRLSQIVNAICQSSQNNIYKVRTDEFKGNLERSLKSAKEDFMYKKRGIWNTIKNTIA